MAPSSPCQGELVVAGAGVQALTLALHLVHRDPSWRERLAVVDPLGEWLGEWHRRFYGLDIEHLRSPLVHHPHPLAFALQRFAAGRQSELYPPYARPGTELFDDFCRACVRDQGLQSVLAQGRVLDAVPDGDGVRVLVEHGQQRHWQPARALVLALGQGAPRWPAWAQEAAGDAPRGAIAHAEGLDLRGERLAAERILVVGGGLTAAQLALSAGEAGAQVELAARRRLRAQWFDVSAGWVGERYLRAFRRESSLERRAEWVSAARVGGSVPPPVRESLEARAATEGFTLSEGVCVESARWYEGEWRVTFAGGRRAAYERIWLACGWRAAPSEPPLLQRLMASAPARLHGGWPALDECLKWPGLAVYAMGEPAALQLGPAAGNLAGARLAARRLVDCLGADDTG